MKLTAIFRRLLRPFQTRPALVRRSLLFDKVELLVPDDFYVMAEESIAIKYPPLKRPTFVYTDESGGLNIAFNLTQSEVSQEELPEFLQFMKTFFGQAHPTAEWLDSGMKIIHGRQVGYLELITEAVDTRIYNLLFMTDLEGYALLISFNCTIRDRKQWQPVAHRIMESLQVKP